MGFTVHWYVRPDDGWNLAFDRFVAVAPKVAAAAGADPALVRANTEMVVYANPFGETFMFCRDPEMRFSRIPELTGDWCQGFVKHPDEVVFVLLAAAKAVFGEMCWPVADGPDEESLPLWADAFRVVEAAGVAATGPVSVGAPPPDLPPFPPLI